MYANRLLSIAISSAFFGYIGYIGLYIKNGNSFDEGARGVLAIAMRAINGLIDSFGYQPVGLGIIVLALFGGIYAAIWIWRNMPF